MNARVLVTVTLLSFACSETETLAPDLRCAVSCPLVFARRDDAGVWDIFTISEFGTQLRNLTRDTITDILPVWSSDHRQIAFVSERNPAGIWIMNADGSDQRWLWSQQPDNLSWSPDGRLLAFGTSDIWIVGTYGRPIKNLTPLGGFETRPTWSPRGDRLAFACDSRICAIDTSGTNYDTLTDGSVPVSDPAWSPDGKRIAFAAFEAPDVASIWVMNADGSNWRRLTTTTGSDRLPAWSPTGTAIAFQRAGTAGSEIRIVTVDGSREWRVIAGLNGHVSW